MRRLVVILSLAIAFLPSAIHSTAFSQSSPTLVPTVFNGECFVGAFNTLEPCPSPTVTRALQLPTKNISVGAAFPGPDGVTNYTVTVVSQFVCFGLNEPIQISLLGDTSPAAITALYPTYSPSSGTSVRITPDATGTAQLALEVRAALVGANGLFVKAIWPQEGVEQIVPVINPASTTTAGPSTRTPVPTTSPAATGTTPMPSPTAVPPTPVVSSKAPAVQACTSPDVLFGHSLGGDSPTLYGLTVPGAVCTASVTYYPDRSHPTSFDGSAQTALADGLVIYSWTEDSTGDFGIATVTCNTGGASTTACTAFLIAQTSTQDLLTASSADVLTRIASLEATYCPAGSVRSQSA